MFVSRVIDRVRPEEKRRHDFCFRKMASCVFYAYIHTYRCVSLMILLHAHSEKNKEPVVTASAVDII